MKYFIKFGSSFQTDLSDPLLYRWKLALRDPAYLLYVSALTTFVTVVYFVLR